jgi:hypothetical protein
MERYHRLANCVCSTRFGGVSVLDAAH